MTDVSKLTAQEAFDALLGAPGDPNGQKYGCTLETVQTYRPSPDELKSRPERKVSTDEVLAVWAKATSVCLIYNPLDGARRSPQFTKEGHTVDDLLGSIVRNGAPRQIAARWPADKRPPFGLVAMSKDHVLMTREGEWDLICRIDAASREEGTIT